MAQSKDKIDKIRAEIANDSSNAWAKKLGYRPVFQASLHSRIVIVGQAPGRKAQESGKSWNDPSGVKLRSWLGVTDEQFYNPELFALTAMDFYFPGKAAHGDLPPRKDFAPKWHPKLLAAMPNVQLIILIGAYSQAYYLGERRKSSLTATVQSHEDYLPQYFPLVHPSPLNFRWLSKNPWFEHDVVPVLHERVHKILTA